MPKLFILLFLNFSLTFANETWMCLMQTSYSGFDGTVMRQEAVYDLAITARPSIEQYKLKIITNLRTGDVVESFYKKDPLVNKSVFLSRPNTSKSIVKEVRKIKDLIFAKDKNGKLKYPCPYWIKAMYDQHGS